MNKKYKKNPNAIFLFSFSSRQSTTGSPQTIERNTLSSHFQRNKVSAR